MRKFIQIAKPGTLGAVDFAVLMCKLDDKWLFVKKKDENGKLCIELPECPTRSDAVTAAEDAATVLVFRLMHRFEFEIMPIFDCESELDGETHYGRVFLMCADSRPDELEADFYSVEEIADLVSGHDQILSLIDSAAVLARVYFK